jgi:hypothetical protein
MSSGFESMTTDDPNHQAYLDAVASQREVVQAAQRVILETPPLPDRPSEEPERAAAPEGDGSPSALDQHEVALDLEWSRLKEELPKAETSARDAAAHLKRVKNDLEAARQLVAHHRRLRQRLAK